MPPGIQEPSRRDTPMHAGRALLVKNPPSLTPTPGDRQPLPIPDPNVAGMLNQSDALQLIGLPDTTTRAARTLRRRLLQIPGRLTSHARGWTLHLPARWPWHDDYTAALKRIRALPAPA
jgi:hypothetical protein